MSTVAGERPVLILAGGTGGHIFPGLAVAGALRARDVPVHWLGADGGMETRLVPQHGISLDTIAVRGLRGKGAAALLGAPGRVVGAVRAAAVHLRRLRPRAVISFGGYAAGPAGMAAWMAGVPLLVHEQNRAPGLTNRILARMARTILVGFPDTFHAHAERVVGNPVREDIARIALPEQRFQDRAGPMRVLVIGGSQGARALNQAVPQALKVLADEGISLQLRHQCGEALLEETWTAYAEAGVAGTLEPFIADMAEAYAWADVVLCRAGALTLAELCAAGVGSLLVPYPHAVDDHQTRNAEYLVQGDAAVLLPQADDLAQRLVDQWRMLAADPARRLAMAVAARALARPDAAARVADAVLEVAS